MKCLCHSFCSTLFLTQWIGCDSSHVLNFGFIWIDCLCSSFWSIGYVSCLVVGCNHLDTNLIRWIAFGMLMLLVPFRFSHFMSWFNRVHTIILDGIHCNTLFSDSKTTINHKYMQYKDIESIITIQFISLIVYLCST